MDSNDGDMEDRLSKLPDDVLENIFSFLHIKDVVKTSVLSKRWEYAWISAPILDFTYRNTELSKHSTRSSAPLFEKFVRRVLSHHRDRGVSIKKCTFRFFSKTVEFPSWKTWIGNVLASNVQVLCVCVGARSDFVLPPSLYTCRTLVVLKLDGRFTLKPPLYIDFPSLKTLSLQNVKFVDDFSMQRLVSCCPAIEAVEVTSNGSLNWHSEQISSISIPSLKRLVIRSHRCETITSFVDNVSEKFSVSLLDNYVSSSIEGSCSSKILEDISHLTMLPKLSKRAMVELGAESDSLIPIFRNLTSLQLEIYDIGDKHLLSTLVMHSRNLAFLSFTRRLGEQVGDHRGYTTWFPTKSRRNCLLNLERVEFHRFHGTEFEKSVARYILGHAPVLREMCIYLHNLGSGNVTSRDQTLMQSACDAISSYKRRSSTCKVRFKDPNVAKRKYSELSDP